MNAYSRGTFTLIAPSIDRWWWCKQISMRCKNRFYWQDRRQRNWWHRIKGSYTQKYGKTTSKHRLACSDKQVESNPQYIFYSNCAINSSIIKLSACLKTDHNVNELCLLNELHEHLNQRLIRKIEITIWPWQEVNLKVRNGKGQR
jgi:hypothetical protein